MRRIPATRISILAFILFAGSALAQTAIVGVDVERGQYNLRILAQNIDESQPSQAAVGIHKEGIGAEGRQASAPSIKTETGHDPISGRSERILFEFDTPVVRAELDLTYFYAAEAELDGIAYHERGVWQAYRGNRHIDRGMFVSNATDGRFRLLIAARAPFDRLEISATPYVTDAGQEIAQGRITTDSSDFLINRLSYAPMIATGAGD